MTGNPLFSLLDQPRIGAHLAPSAPMSFDGRHVPPRPAPANGDDTAAILAEHLGLTPDEIARLVESGAVHASSPLTDKDLP